MHKSNNFKNSKAITLVIAEQNFNTLPNNLKDLIGNKKTIKNIIKRHLLGK